MAARMTNSAQNHSPFALGHQFLSVPQTHVFDPAVVNAAATIAVATAQAVHQVNNVFGSQAGGPNLAAALGDSRNSLLGRQGQMPTMAQIAALLSNGGMQVPFNSNPAALQHFLNLGGSAQSLQGPTQTQGALSTASSVAPSATVTSTQAQTMQSWSVEQLGTVFFEDDKKHWMPILRRSISRSPLYQQKNM